jgi:hypothetical protein
VALSIRRPCRSGSTSPHRGRGRARMPSPAAAANITVNARGAAFMSESTKFSIGSRVACSDGRCGELRRVVVDPVAGAITHLVVEPRHRSGMGHLVPVDLVASTGKKIRLRCSKSEFEALDDAEKTRFLPGASGDWDYEQQQASARGQRRDQLHLLATALRRRADLPAGVQLGAIDQQVCDMRRRPRRAGGGKTPTSRRWSSTATGTAARRRRNGCPAT